ncbi:MAG: elongator complex protein 3 [Peptococcales bacterium]
MSNTLIIPIFVSHMGCPHTCIFCNQHKIAGSFREPTKDEIKEKVFKYRSTYPDIENAYVELAFYGGSFTGIRKDLQEELLSTALSLKKEKLIDGIRLSTRPDYITQQIVERLLFYGVTTVEIGVQTLDDEVLTLSQRGHNQSAVENAVGFLKKSGIKVGIQLMPGLPHDSMEKVIQTTMKVIGYKPNFVRIYPTVVIRETELARLFYEGIYQPWPLETTIEIVAMMAILFAQAHIPIIRMGLQAAPNLVIGEDLIAGPYHPSFGELVMSRVFRKQLEFLLTKNILKLDSKENNLTIFCHPRDISKIKGQKRSNILYFKEKFNLTLEIIVMDHLPLNSLAWMENNVTKVFSRRDFLDKYRNTIGLNY